MRLFEWLFSFNTMGGGREDYERLLTDLDQQIRVLEVKLMEGRLAERSLSLRLIGTGVVTYLGIIFYVFILTTLPTPLHLLLVVTFPFGLYYLKRLFGWVYGRKIVRMEEELQALRGNQSIKLEELKQKSDYYRTIKLIERFDHQKKDRTTPKKETPSIQPQAPTTTATTISNVQPTVEVVNRKSSVPVLPRGWLDRWTDYLLGEEDSSIRYALICNKCHAHNGLSLVPVVPFSCRNCHYLNNNSSNVETGAIIKKNLLLKNVVVPDVDATPIAEHPQLRKKSK